MRNQQLAGHYSVTENPGLPEAPRQARFAELMTQAETAARTASTCPGLVHQGSAIRVEVTAEEQELLERGAAGLQLDFIRASPGLPVAVLRTLIKGVEFRLGIPLWQAAAQDWLLDAADRGDFLLLVEKADRSPGHVALNGFGHLLADRLSLIVAATLTRELEAGESHSEMVRVGLSLMKNLSQIAPLPGSPPTSVRVAMVGQGKGARATMEALRGLELNEVATLG